MKKKVSLLSILMIVVFLISLAGCSPAAETPGEPAEPMEEPAEPMEEPAEPSEEPAEPMEEPAEPAEAQEFITWFQYDQNNTDPASDERVGNE